MPEYALKCAIPRITSYVQFGVPMVDASRVFEIVDSSDAALFATLFAEDGRIIFGNAEPIVGRAAIEAGVGEFFTTIKALHHRVVNEWVSGRDTVVELEVTYDRLDGKSVSVPVVSIWTVDDQGLIAHYRIFFDLTPVYAA